MVWELQKPVPSKRWLPVLSGNFLQFYQLSAVRKCCMSYLRENWILEFIWMTVHKIWRHDEGIETSVVLRKVQIVTAIFRFLNAFTYFLVSSILSPGIPLQDAKRQHLVKTQERGNVQCCSTVLSASIRNVGCQVQICLFYLRKIWSCHWQQVRHCNMASKRLQ